MLLLISGGTVLSLQIVTMPYLRCSASISAGSICNPRMEHSGNHFLLFTCLLSQLFYNQKPANDRHQDSLELGMFLLWISVSPTRAFLAGLQCSGLQRAHMCVCKPRLQTRNMRFLIQTGQVAVFKLSQIFLQSRAHFSKTFFWRTQIMLGCIIHILTYFLPGVRVGGPGDVGDTLPQLKKGWCISLSLSPIEILAR